MADGLATVEVKTATLFVDAGFALPGEDALRVAVEVRVPAVLAEPAVALFCLPGGGMNRRYFDLMPEDGDSSFSFAAEMCARGFIVVLVDHLGLGQSSIPRNGWALTPQVLAQANASAVSEVSRLLRTGELLPELPPLPQLATVGVGHSMGAMLTIVQQAQHRQHAGIAVLGFSCEGLAAYLCPEGRALIGQAEAFRAQLAEIARAQFGEAYALTKPSKPASTLYAGATADPRGILSIKSAVDRLLALPATLSMYPGNVAPEAAAITAPVFLAVGELDMTGPAHKIPASFTACHDLTLHILPQAGHSHFLFPARFGLYARLAAWAAACAR